MSTRRLIIQVDVPEDATHKPTAQEIFLQAMELLDLASEDASVNWGLVSVTKNSPLTIAVEARRPPERPYITDQLLDDAPYRFQRRIQALTRGDIDPEWRRPKERARLKAVLSRATQTATSFAVAVPPDPEWEPKPPGTLLTSSSPDTGDYDQIFKSGYLQLQGESSTLTPTAARAALEAIEKTPVAELGATKDQIGSVSGVLTEVRTHYRKPAIVIRDRRTGEDVLCEITESDRQRIAAKASFDDVWRGRRVMVTGRIVYGPNRSIAKVIASAIRVIDQKAIDEVSIKSSDFTDSLSPEEYLDRFREGSLGG